MADETGFFRFDTNINAVVADIEGGLRRLNGALAGGNTSQTFGDAKVIGRGLGDLERELDRGLGRINALMGDVGAGRITNKNQLQDRIKQVIRGTVSNIPFILSDEIAKLSQTNPSALKRQDFGAIARITAQDYVNALTSAVQAQQGALESVFGGKVRATPADFKGAVAAVGANPVEFGYPTQAREDFLRNQVLTQDYARKLFAARSGANDDDEGSIRRLADLEAEINRLGLKRPVQSLLDTHTQTVTTEEGGAYKYLDIPNTAKEELAELTRERKLDEVVATRQKRASKDLEEQMRREALAALADAEAWERLGKTRFRDPATGQVYKKAGKGLVEDDAYKSKDDFQADRAAQERAAEEKTARENVALQNRANQEKAQQRAAEEKSARETVALQNRANQDQARTAREQFQLAKDTVAIQRRADQEKVAAAREALRLQKLDARAQLNNSGFTGGLVNRFQRGEQSFSTGLGAQVGSALGFSAAYGAIFAVQAALRDTMKEFLDYQDSVTDLEVATRNADVVTGSWVNTLSELSRVSGDNVGAALDAAARGVRAFTTAASSEGDIKAAGEATAKTATRLALIANKPLPDATGDIVATGSAFGLRPDQLEQIVDAVANAKRNVGGDASQISQGLSLIALSAQEAGFNLNEAAAVIGLVQARTDQSGQAIATRLTRIFQIVQGSTGQTLARQLNVDPTASVKDRLEAFATIYADQRTSEATRNRIASSLGGTANLRELLPLLKENTTLQAAYQQALDNSGQGTDEYNRKTQNLVGTLKKIAGDISNIQVGLGKSGLFDFVGIGLKSLEPALYGLSQLLNLYNEMPRPLRTALGLTLDLVLATKALGALTATGLTIKGLAHTAGLSGAAAAAEAQVARQRENAVIVAMTQQRLLAEGRFNEALALANARRIAVETEGAAIGAAGGVRGGFGTLGRFLTSPTALLTGGVLAGLAIYGVAKQEANQRDNILDVADNSFKSLEGIVGGSAAQLAAAAQDMNSAAGEIRKSDAPGDFRVERGELATAASNRGQTLLYLSQLAEKDERMAVANQRLTVFGTGAIETVDQLATGLQTIALNGGTALDAYNAIVKALTTPPPPEDTQYFTRQGLNNAIITTLLKTAGDSVPEGSVVFPNGRGGGTGIAGDAPPVPFKGIQNPTAYTAATGKPAITDTAGILSQLGLTGDPNNLLDTGLQSFFGIDSNQARTAEAMNKALNKAQRKLKLNPSKGLTNAQMTELVNLAADIIDLGPLGEQADEMRANLRKNALEKLQTHGIGTAKLKTNTPLDLLNGNGGLTNAQITELLSPKTDVPEGQPTYAGLPAIFDAAQQAIPTSDDGSQLEAVQKSQAKVYRELARRNRAAGEDSSTLQLLAANAQHAYLETAVANLDDLREAAESRATSNKELRAVRLRFAKQEFDKAGSDVSVLEPLMESLDRRTVSQVIAYVKTARDVARAALQHARAIIRAARAAFASTSLLGGAAGALFGISGPSTDQLDALENAKNEFGKRSKQYKALLDALNQSTITDKVAKLPDAGGKSPEDLAAERRAAAEERLNNAIDALQLTGDFTDPVEQARDALRAARMRYRFEKTPGNLVDVRTSEAALEKAKWDQKLSDMQTAEQLGRISYATYTRYLQNESDRLHKINHKTRQQIDYMNQIDLALKETTASMEGQFNLGDIDTKGFVYAVRRMMGGGSGNGNGPGGVFNDGPRPGGVINNNQQINFTGIDERTLRRVLRDIMGGVPIHTTSSRKVA